MTPETLQELENEREEIASEDCETCQTTQKDQDIQRLQLPTMWQTL